MFLSFLFNFFTQTYSFIHNTFKKLSFFFDNCKLIYIITELFKKYHEKFLEEVKLNSLN